MHLPNAVEIANGSTAWTLAKSVFSGVGAFLAVELPTNQTPVACIVGAAALILVALINVIPRWRDSASKSAVAEQAQAIVNFNEIYKRSEETWKERLQNVIANCAERVKIASEAADARVLTSQLEVQQLKAEHALEEQSRHDIRGEITALCARIQLYREKMIEAGIEIDSFTLPDIDALLRTKDQAVVKASMLAVAQTVEEQKKKNTIRLDP